MLAHCEGKEVISNGDVIHMILRLYNGWEQRGIYISDSMQSAIPIHSAGNESDESVRVTALTRQFDEIMTIRAGIFWKTILERARLAEFNLAFEKEIDTRMKSYHPQLMPEIYM